MPHFANECDLFFFIWQWSSEKSTKTHFMEKNKAIEKLLYVEVNAKWLYNFY